MKNFDPAQLVGILAGLFTAVSLIPQIVKMVRERTAQEISFAYLAILLTGLSLWIVYGIMRKDLPVIITNIVSVVINLITVAVGIKYKK